MPLKICDSHLHIFGDPARYPTVPAAFYRPREASLSDYRNLLGPHGIERLVIVQPSCYGTDNSCLLDTLRATGDRGRGVGGIGPATPREGALRLWRAGVMGARFNSVAPGAPTLDDMFEVAPLLRDVDLHAEIFTDGRRLCDLERPLIESGLTVVIAHFGPVNPELGLDQPVVRVLNALLETGRVWIKLSAPYRLSKARRYEDLGRFARHLVAVRPDRIVWGSDWPYVQHEDLLASAYNPVAALRQWIDDPPLVERILCDNPRKLYGFEGG